MLKLIIGVLVPFLGTTIGAFLVFFVNNEINSKLEKNLLAFAGGVMMAASVWSLIIPAINQSSFLGTLSFLPASIGIILGIMFLVFLDFIIPRLQSNIKNLKQKPNNTTMLVIAVSLHNIPEGMAVGVALAGAFFGDMEISITASLVLSLGIAIQNIPEGAIISLPLMGKGFSKRKAFVYGVLSGVVEPVFALLTILLTSIVTPIMPYLLSFAGGAMIYVVVKELIPESQTENNNLATLSFVTGFLLMMILDIALG